MIDTAPSTAVVYVGTEQGVARFWSVEVDGASHTVRYGKQGTDGQERTKSFASSALAAADAARLTAEKIAAGYTPAA